MRFRTLGLLLVLWACGNPAAVTLCACSSIEPAVEVRATLVSATGAPQPGKRVRALTAPLPCTTFLDNGGVGPVTDSTGYARLIVFGPANDSLCVRFAVRDTVAGAIEQTLVGTTRVRTSLPPYEVATVSLVLPP